jgi:hypothetical protein
MNIKRIENCNVHYQRHKNVHHKLAYELITYFASDLTWNSLAGGEHLTDPHRRQFVYFQDVAQYHVTQYFTLFASNYAFRPLERFRQ